MVQVALKVTQAFFDRKAVIDKIGPARARALAKAGAFIQRRAKSSMRERKQPSPPGQPPSVHKGALRRLLFFSYDDRAQSVVVGPVPLNFIGVVPPALEYGGQTRRKNQLRRIRRVGTRGEIELDAPPARRVRQQWNRKRDQATGRWVRYTHIATAEQARRANRLNAALYGDMWIAGAPVAERPYMRPALAAEMPHFPNLFADSIK